MTNITKIFAALTIAVLSAFAISTPASADAPSFDSDCVGPQWVIRNRGAEPFNVGTPDGDVYMAVDAIWEPGDDLASVIISDTVIVRPSCEVLAPVPVRTALPATGTSLVLALLAVTLVAAGAATWRIGHNSERG